MGVEESTRVHMKSRARMESREEVRAGTTYSTSCTRVTVAWDE
jgi:hypothetical protein